MHTPWHGVFPAITTQFHTDESVDTSATLRHLDRLMASGIHGVIFLGTVGENCSLTHHEKIELLGAAAAHIKGRIPLLTGVAESTTRLACTYARDAAKAGVDGLMVLPAMVYKSDAREAIYHISSVADAASLPVMVYNNPVSYGVDLKPEDFGHFTKNPLITSIKESSENPRRITGIRRIHGDRFRLFCGVDDLVLESFPGGIDGWISGLVNAFPAENAALWSLLVSGRFAEARVLAQWYAPLLELDTLPKLVQYIKLAMAEVGLGSELCRAPRLAITGDERARVLGIIRDAIRTRPDLAAFGTARSS